jgi:hypothetical protein
LNTQVAKNWARFDNFLELFYSFAVGDEEIAKPAVEGQKELSNDE